MVKIKIGKAFAFPIFCITENMSYQRSDLQKITKCLYKTQKA